MPKEAETKRDCVINPQNYNFNQFLHGKFLCSQNATNQLQSTIELGYMCPQGLTGPPAVENKLYVMKHEPEGKEKTNKSEK